MTTHHLNQPKLNWVRVALAFLGLVLAAIAVAVLDEYLGDFAWALFN